MAIVTLDQLVPKGFGMTELRRPVLEEGGSLSSQKGEDVKYQFHPQLHRVFRPM